MAENAPSGDQMETARPGKDAALDKIYHTVTACVRCRQRKTRCDPTLPRCEPCERSNARCEYFDSTKNRTISRTYITSLQANVRRLQAELSAAERVEVHEPDSESMARAAGMIKFHENDESRFLGPSSGIAITRFILHLARQNTVNKSIKDVVPDRTALEIKKKFDAESAKPTSKVYPLISSVAAPGLPSQELMDRLVEIYMVKAQYLQPLLHEPSFRQELQAVYQGSTDPTLNFQVRLVLAISMQKLDTQYAGLADSYYLAALPYLEMAVRKMDLSTLQCLVLIGEYSVLTPTRTAAYWVVGLAARICQDLGLCDEKTMHEFPPGVRFNPLEVDLRRRLFWIVTSMEFGLAHILGRPSAFGTSVDNINVKFFEMCDDRFITPTGLLPGHHPVMKKCLAIHFFKMRLLQAEIRRTLYLRKRESPVDDQDPWFQDMLDRIDHWVKSRPQNDEGSGVSELLQARADTLVVFLLRPSPQIPQPSLRAAQRCYDASVYVIKLQKYQIESKMVDLTWILTQTMFMAVNAILWSLSYPEIREQHPLTEARSILEAALGAIELTADRWPGVQSACQLYENIIISCLKAYQTGASYVISSSNTTSPTSTQDYGSPASQVAFNSPASTAATSLVDPRSPPTVYNHSNSKSQPSQLSSLPSNGVAGQQHSPNLSSTGMKQAQSLPKLQAQDITTTTSAVLPPNPAVQTLSAPFSHYSLPSFDLQLSGYDTSNASQPFGPPPTAMTTSMANANYLAMSNMEIDEKPWLGYFGDEYSRYLQQPFFPAAQQMQSLDQYQQRELMATLENSELPNVSAFLNESTALYPSHMDLWLK